MEKKNLFLAKYKENGDFNQYWYSQKTIEFIARQVDKYSKHGAAFLSTPSVFPSVQSVEIKKASYIFDVSIPLNFKFLTKLPISSF